MHLPLSAEGATNLQAVWGRTFEEGVSSGAAPVGEGHKGDDGAWVEGVTAREGDGHAARYASEGERRVSEGNGRGDAGIPLHARDEMGEVCGERRQWKGRCGEIARTG